MAQGRSLTDAYRTGLRRVARTPVLLRAGIRKRPVLNIYAVERAPGDDRFPLSDLENRVRSAAKPVFRSQKRKTKPLFRGLSRRVSRKIAGRYGGEFRFASGGFWAASRLKIHGR